VATARDIAQAAGVSTSTVSHVLNGTRWVSSELRERVIAAADALGYEPDALARSLRIRRSNTIGLLISDIANPFFTAVVRGVQDVLQARGYALIVSNSDEDPEKEAAYLRVLKSRRVDGIILAPAGVDHPYLARLARSAFPLVFLDREVHGLAVAAAILDNRRAARDAMDHLLRLGHRRIALVAGHPQISSTGERIAGYRAALESAGLEYDDRLVESGGSRIGEARSAVEKLLGLDPRPTAIFVTNNLMTIGAMAGIRSSDLRVPIDISLCAIDDFNWADVFEPRLTTVAQPTYELGRVAADLVLRRIAGDLDTATARVVLPGHLIIRDSTAAVNGGFDVRSAASTR
jgi:LacI family transcriptional regulator